MTLLITDGPAAGHTCEVLDYVFTGEVVVRLDDGRAPVTVPRTDLQITAGGRS